jgi:DHA3 family macrolide efflux protein-like MFS transporter
VRTFYTIIVTQIFSMIGSQISGLVIGIYLYQSTGNATPLALTAFFAMLPTLFAASIAGVVSDRFSRRYIIAFADLGQAIVTFGLFLSFSSGSFQVWHLYLASLIQQSFAVFQNPAFSASVTMLVPPEKRDQANSLTQITGPMAGIVAPAIAGVVYVLVGVPGAIVIDLLTFVVAFSVMMRLDIPQPQKTKAGAELSGSWRKEFTAGFTYLWARRPLFWLAMFAASLNFLLAGIGTLTTPYILARTHSEPLLGVISSLINVGMVIGAVSATFLINPKYRIWTVIWTIVLSTLMIALFGMAQSPLALIGIGFVMLVPLPATNSSFMSLLQEKVAPDVQGRVFALVNQIALFLAPLSNLLIGPLVDQVFEPAVGQAGWERVAPFVGNEPGAGIGLLIVFCGLGAAAMALIAYAQPSIREAERKLPSYEAKPTSVEAIESAVAV